MNPETVTDSSVAAGQSGLMGFLPLIFIFVVFYFLLIRPQVKRNKEQKQMIESLEKNDELVTSGGLLGRIKKIDESFIELEIAKDVQVKIQKSSVATLVPKGTFKPQ